MWQQNGQPTTKCQCTDQGPRTFKDSDEYGSVVVSSGQDVDGLNFFLWVKPSMREKIAHNEFVEIGRILQEADPDEANSQEDREAGVITADQPNQAMPYDPKTRIQLVQNLILFACFYLQKYPAKTFSFLDYLLFLISWSAHLTVAGLVQLDHEMRPHFLKNPDWSWRQDHRPCQLALINVSLKEEYTVKKLNQGAPSSANRFGGPQHFRQPQQSWSRSVQDPKPGYKGKGKSNGQNHKYFDRRTSSSGAPGSSTNYSSSPRNEICNNYNVYKCNYSKCKRVHTCYCGSEHHRAPECNQKHLWPSQSTRF